MRGKPSRPGGCRALAPTTAAPAALIALTLVVLLVACGSDEPRTPTVPPFPSPIPASTPLATASPPPSGPATTRCSPAAAVPADALVAFGATLAAWNAHHEMDPLRADFYLPYLNDGLDRYSHVLCTPAGRVISYRVNHIPPIGVSQTRAAFRSELPGDAVLVHDTVQFGCEHIQYRSAALARALAGDDPDGVVDGAIILPSDPVQGGVVTLFIDATAPLNQLPAAC